MRNVCAGLPDKRGGRNIQYTMADIGMAAFSVFFVQSPSFLGHQRRLLEGRGRSNCQTLFAMTEIPSDNHIRAMLDPISPDAFQPAFDAGIRALEAGGGLAPFRRLGGHVLIALDGTQYHRSAKVHCRRCSTVSSGGKIEYFHAMVSAALVAPAHTRVVPLEPEFVEPQDGTEKQDCDSRACRRWLATMGQPMRISDPSISATICIPASQSARPCIRLMGTSCSSASRPPIRRCRNISRVSNRSSTSRRSSAARRAFAIPTDGYVTCLSATARMPCSSTGLRSRSPTPTARSPTAIALSPTAGRPRHRRRACRLRPRQMESRERELQYAQDQGLQPRAQFRSRQR